MPSSHAQFVAFWSVSLTLFLLIRHRPARQSTGERRGLDRPWSLLERAAVSIAGLAIAGAVAWSRTYLGYHTSRQVLVGTVAGVFSAVAWFILTSQLRATGWLTWLLDTQIARTLRTRDLIVLEDMCQAGWEKWEGRQQSEAKQKPKSS